MPFGEYFFGVYLFAEVGFVLVGLHAVFVGVADFRFESERPTEPLGEFAVVVEQKFVFLFVKRVQLVGVVFEEGRRAVCRYDGVPVQVPPFAVIGDADVAGVAFRRVGLYDRNRQGQNAVCTAYVAAVAIGLLGVVAVAFDRTFFAPVE